VYKKPQSETGNKRLREPHKTRSAKRTSAAEQKREQRTHNPVDGAINPYYKRTKRHTTKQTRHTFNQNQILCRHFPLKKQKRHENNMMR